MPKQKTNKGVAKRVRVTKNGKVKYHAPGRRHLLSNKSGKRRRQMRKLRSIAKAYAQKYQTVTNQ
jgi:large subunit ribosomal protein L35